MSEAVGVQVKVPSLAMAAPAGAPAREKMRRAEGLAEEALTLKLTVLGYATSWFAA